MGFQWTLEESFYFAENTLISIFPSVHCPKVSLVIGEYGPFKVPSQVKVPLWMALVMKKNAACHILMPEWLSVGKYTGSFGPLRLYLARSLCVFSYNILSLDALQFKLAEEENIPDEFSFIHPYWYEISQLLLSK